MQLDQAITALQSIAKALNDANNTNSELVVFTAILAFSSIAFGFMTLRKTSSQIRKAEERQEKEHFERVRPWVVVDGPVPAQVIFEDGNAIPWEDFNKYQTNLPVVKVLMQYTYTNRGIKIARDLKQIRLPKDEPFSKEVVQNEKELDVKMDLGPNQSQHTNVEIPWNRWEKLDNLPLYMGYQISYDNGRNRSTSGSIYKIFPRGSSVIETWYT